MELCFLTFWEANSYNYKRIFWKLSENNFANLECKLYPEIKVVRIVKFFIGKYWIITYKTSISLLQSTELVLWTGKAYNLIHVFYRFLSTCKTLSKINTTMSIIWHVYDYPVFHSQQMTNSVWYLSLIKDLKSKSVYSACNHKFLLHFTF